MKPEIQKQVNQVKIWLSQGLTTGQIENKFTQIYTNLPNLNLRKLAEICENLQKFTKIRISKT